MEKNNYLKVQQAARRSRINLTSQILYLIVFLFLIGILLSRLVPVYYYAYFSDDTVTLGQQKDADYVKKEYPVAQTYSHWQRYRDDWFDLTQSNLKPKWTATLPSPFGKTEVYSLFKQVGYKEYEVAKVTNEFLFDKPTTVEVERTLSQNRGSNRQGEWALQYTTLLDLLKENGKYRVANIKVDFKQSQEKKVVDELFMRDGPVDILRYGVDYPQSTTLGYPKKTVNEFISDYEMTEEDFSDKLTNITTNFSKYGNLHLYARELDNFKPATRDDYLNNFLSVENADILTGFRLDLADVADYLDHNGIQYSNLLITGDCASLAEWLEEHQDGIQGVEIQELMDWNGSMSAMKEE